MSYITPLKDMLFDIRHLARIEQVAQLPGFEDAGFETAQAVLEECARFTMDTMDAASATCWSAPMQCHPGSPRRQQPGAV